MADQHRTPSRRHGDRPRAVRRPPAEPDPLTMLQATLGNEAMQAMVHNQGADTLFEGGASSPGATMASPLGDGGSMTVHQGPEAEAALTALNAAAATREDQVLLSRAAGPEVLAHEAAHVAQNRAHGPARGGIDGGASDTAERDAHSAVRAARQGQARGPMGAPGAELQRFSLGALWGSIEDLADDALQTIRGWFGGDEDEATAQTTSPQDTAGQDTSTAAQDSTEQSTPVPDEATTSVLADGLHFFPGVYKLVYVKGGKVVTTIEAHGGPAKEQPTSNGTMPPGPTDSGDFLIDEVKPYHTPTWAWSSIDWGVKLQDKGNDIWYELPSGQYGSLQRDHGLSRQDVIAYHQSLYGTAIVPKTWVFNDFGPKSIRYYRDLNGNGKRDSDEHLEGEMFHTTPKNEAQDANGEEVTLEDSHGCIHIKPADRDALLKIGAFSSGMAFKIHAYDETWSAP